MIPQEPVNFYNMPLAPPRALATPPPAPAPPPPRLFSIIYFLSNSKKRRGEVMAYCKTGLAPVYDPLPI